FSIVFPAALSAAGRTEGIAAGPALAAVSTAGYTGFLIGPPTIGFVAELVGLGGALYIVVALSTAIVLLAGAVRGK
ncbi:MAG: MFS transporter, partial [Actinomycetota bacterium]|nr:MFS transporter [Actinomycetota bacterium]